MYKYSAKITSPSRLLMNIKRFNEGQEKMCNSFLSLIIKNFIKKYACSPILLFCLPQIVTGNLKHQI